MKPSEVADLFSRLPTNQFDAWLNLQQQDALRFLVSSIDLPVIHRAQGKLILIDEMKKLLAAGKTLR